MAYLPASTRKQSSVAVIVPVFNRARTILAALDSILNQSRPPDRLIVVDDGSVDDSVASVRAWFAQHREHLVGELLVQANGGPGLARNCGAAAARAAQCEVLAFLDSDDLWPPDYLAKMVAKLEANPAAVAVSSDRLLSNLRSGRQKLVRPFKTPTPRASAHFLEFGAPLPSSTVVRSEIFFAVGGFRKQYRVHEDWDLFLRMSRHGVWEYAIGEPLPVIQSGIAGTGDHANLTDTLDTTSARRAALRIIRDFLSPAHGPAPLSAPGQRRVLARAWHRLGKAYLNRGQPRLAMACCNRALAYDWRSLRIWSRKLKLLYRLAQANSPAG